MIVSHEVRLRNFVVDGLRGGSGRWGICDRLMATPILSRIWVFFGLIGGCSPAPGVRGGPDGNADEGQPDHDIGNIGKSIDHWCERPLSG